VPWAALPTGPLMVVAHVAMGYTVPHELGR
jgi:hypothetical protein